MSKSSRRFGVQAIAAITVPSLMLGTGVAFAPVAGAVESEQPTVSAAPAETVEDVPAADAESEVPAETAANDSDSTEPAVTETEPQESAAAEEAPTSEVTQPPTSDTTEDGSSDEEKPQPTPVKVDRVPSLSTNGPTTFPVGTQFSPSDLNPVAIDPEDGDISDQVEVVSNNVDTVRPGEYQVEFAVYDSFGNRAAHTAYVTITPKRELNKTPSITVNGPTTFPVGTNFSPDDLSVSASDPEDGDLTDQLEIISNNVNTATPGDYEVVYAVTDSAGARHEQVIPITITPKKKLNEVPAITVNGPTTFPVGTNFSPDDLDATAFDPEDGDLTDKIEIVSNDVDTVRPGDYTVVLAVTDSAGARHEQIVPIKIVPKTVELNAAPILKAPDSIEIDQGTDFSDPVDVIKATAQDEEDGDLSDKIEVVSNTVDPDTPGNYQVVLRVTDSDGASTKKAVDVHVKPKDEKEDSSVTIFVATVVNLHIGINFDDPIAVLHATASSKIDGNLTGSIQVIANDVNINVAGTYHVTLAVTASNGTKSEKTVEVLVQDKDGKVVSSDHVSKSDSNNHAVGNDTTHQKQDAVANHSSSRSLANTGASVLGIVVAGLALVGGGLLLSRRRKQS
ncbi:immunoglobulin-like domain-containing protein [Corynebacterium gerontici]|uniref:Pesticidal crystal protein cry22Aa n=1 Tax=Corynebacterium gerontici TaxID=2079234 RepID=A0A3G6J3P7_9CORY|nr:immunoglobulin-like domain-containing protein [Corynebacterium gerontici]AZA12323.1 Pesticidal crystal protein cry22Aa [Corynebacterium gerontici]